MLVTQVPTLSPTFEFMIPLAVVFLACCVIVTVCCCHFSMRRSFTTITQGTSAYPTGQSLPLNAEARVLLPAHPDGTQVEVSLRMLYVKLIQVLFMLTLFSVSSHPFGCYLRVFLVQLTVFSCIIQSGSLG